MREQVANYASERLPAAPAYRGERDQGEGSGIGLKLFALFAGLALGAMVPFVIWLADSAQNARNDARTAAAKASAVQQTTAMPGMAPSPSAAGTNEGTYATPSFAGLAPANADALAMAHRAVPAELPAAPAAGPVADVHLSIQHRVVSIAPGIRYDAWTFGNGAPGPAIHVRQGQTVRVTLTNS